MDDPQDLAPLRTPRIAHSRSKRRWLPPLYGCQLERLEHILALKFVGLPLKDIRMALARTPKELSLALGLQHRALQEKQAHMTRALRAIEVARRALEERTADAPSVLKDTIEVIRMQDAVEAMKRYYRSADEWEKRRRYYEEGPAPEWRALYRDAANHLGEDPGSESVQALADRSCPHLARGRRRSRAAAGFLDRLERSRTLARTHEGAAGRVQTGGGHGTDPPGSTLRFQEILHGAGLGTRRRHATTASPTDAAYLAGACRSVSRRGVCGWRKPGRRVGTTPRPKMACSFGQR